MLMETPSVSSEPVDRKPHSEPFDLAAVRSYGGRELRPDDSYHAAALLEAYDEIESLQEQLETVRELNRRAEDRCAEAFVEARGLQEQLQAAQKAQHVQNLEWAISLAESDPLYAEVFRPYFQKIVDALNSNPASRQEDA